jgi:hypothetical protein
MDSQDLYYARTEGLVAEPLGDETLVYDEARDLAHCLTPVASAVWKDCREGRSLSALCDLVASVAPDGDAETLVLAALAELDEKNLLRPAPAADGVSRRVAIRRIAQVAAAPLIISAAVPSPAAATSPGILPQGSLCTTDNQCAGTMICTGGTPGQGGSPTGLKYCSPNSSCTSSGTKPSGGNCTATNRTSCCSRLCGGAPSDNFCL